MTVNALCQGSDDRGGYSGAIIFKLVPARYGCEYLTMFHMIADDLALRSKNK
jgi:hypothetical protein